MPGAAVALPPERSGRSADPGLLARRQGLAAAAAAGMWRTNPPPTGVRLGGMRALVFAPAGVSRATVLHVHGGAFRIGAPEQMGPFAAALARACGVTVVCPAYRLAPEHPYPAALADCWRVLLALVAQDDARPIISGDSAGGGLAASLTALAVALGQAPRALVLLSAWLDLTLTSPSYDANAGTDHLFSRSAATEAVACYLQGNAAADPLASPLLGSVAGFPPTLVNFGLGEVLAGDGERFHQALLAAGVAARRSTFADMGHVAVTRDMSLPGAAGTLRDVVSFIDELTLASAGGGQPVGDGGGEQRA